MNKKILLALSVVIFVVAAGAGAYFYFREQLPVAEKAGETAGEKTQLQLDNPAIQITVAEQLQECLPKSDMASKERCDSLIKQIVDFDSCVAAGFPADGSYPSRCAVPDGRSFAQKGGEEPRREQKYAIFKTDNFEIKYPDWPNIDQGEAPDSKIKIAVADGGCNLIIKEDALPENVTLKDHVEKVIGDLGGAVKISQKIFQTNTAYLDGEITVGSAALRNVSYSYLAKNNIFYGIAFVAEKNSFDKACQPFIKEVTESALVK